MFWRWGEGNDYMTSKWRKPGVRQMNNKIIGQWLYRIRKFLSLAIKRADVDQRDELVIG